MIYLGEMEFGEWHKVGIWLSHKCGEGMLLTEAEQKELGELIEGWFYEKFN